MSKKQDERRRQIRDRRLREAGARMAGVIAARECELCGGRGTVAGFWVASLEVSRQLGAAPGKRKVFGYMLCAECIALPDPPTTRIEDKLIARWQRDTAGVGPN